MENKNRNIEIEKLMKDLKAEREKIIEKLKLNESIILDNRQKCTWNQNQQVEIARLNERIASHRKNSNT